MTPRTRTATILAAAFTIATVAVLPPVLFWIGAGLIVVVASLAWGTVQHERAVSEAAERIHAEAERDALRKKAADIQERNDALIARLLILGEQQSPARQRPGVQKGTLRSVPPQRGGA